MAAKTKKKAQPKKRTASVARTKKGQALLLVLGSGPAIAQLESVLAQAQANGILYHNAVEQQQLANIIGMVATMHAVEVMLDPPKKR